MTTFTDHLPGWFKRKFSGTAADASEEKEGTTASTTTGGASEQEPVVVWEAANLMEAQVVKGRLESEGIPAWIRSESLGAIYGLTAGGLAAAEVFVPAPLADKALEILAPEGEEDLEDQIDEERLEP